MGKARGRHLKPDVAHGGGEELAVLADANGVQVAAYDLHVKAVKHAGLAEGNGAVEGRLAAHVGKQRVRSFTLDDLAHGVNGDGFHIGAVGRLRIGHDGRGVRVDEHDLIPFPAQYAAGLGTRIVKLAGLADDDRT